MPCDFSKIITILALHSGHTLIPTVVSQPLLMTNEIPRTTPPAIKINCDNCEACCCHLEVLLVSDIGVPDHFIAIDKWGGMTLARLDDGWCIALNRDTLMCKIYENRPLVCREFEMGSTECMVEQKAWLPARLTRS